MSDPVFFSPKAPLSLGAVVVLTQAVPGTAGDADRLFLGVAPLDQAAPHLITLHEARDGTAGLAETRAGACVIEARFAPLLPAGTIALVSDAPSRAFARVVSAFYPDAAGPRSLFANRGISPAAFIHPEARLEADVMVDPGVVIGPKAEIGSGTIVGANSVIGPEVRIGRGCAIGAQVTIAHALIGNGVVIRPGVRIGQDSSDFWITPEGPFKIFGLGRVIIQDHVEIGANTTVDRGGLRDTIIGEGSKIASLVHVVRDRLIERHTVVGAGAA